MWGKGVEVVQEKRGGWLATLPPKVRPPRTRISKRIEVRADLTQARGVRPLWEGYAQVRNYPHQNLRAISDRYELTVDTFEAAADRVLEGVKVGLAFVDAIHTGEFVRAQYALLRRHMRPGGLILFDDIQFSEDMADCWVQIAQGGEVRGSARLGPRVGMIELG